jgi:hypothetical protein
LALRCPRNHRAESHPLLSPLPIPIANCRCSEFKCWRLGWVAFTLLMNRHEAERGRCDSSARLLLCHRVRLRATGRPPGTYLGNPAVLCTSSGQSDRSLASAPQTIRRLCDQMIGHPESCNGSRSRSIAPSAANTLRARAARWKRCGAFPNRQRKSRSGGIR